MDMAEGKLMKRIEPWEEAVEKLYKEMYPVLYVYAMRILKDSDMAEEAVQDAFCIACAKRDEFLSSENPQGWVMITLKYVMQNMLRNQAKSKKLASQYFNELKDECTVAGPPELMSVDLLFNDVSESEDFQLLKRIALDQYTIAELSQELGISVEACKKRVQRARKRLRQRLKL